MDIWLERLERVITIFRPKAYNVIARSIIGLGVLLVAESQLNLIQALAIAGYESFFGYSDILRSFIANNSDPATGLFLIIIGLLYHYVMTVGKKQIDLRLSQVPQKPVLDLKLFNADQKPFTDNSIDLRGSIVILPPSDEIPEYRIEVNTPPNLVNLEGLTRAMNFASNYNLNPGFYRERAKLLKLWGGAELITLKILNNSPVLATGVKVAVSFPRAKGISADTTKDDFPELPNSERKDPYNMLTVRAMNVHGISYDVYSDHSAETYNFVWDLNDVQANTESMSNTFIFLRSEQSFEIELTLFCDQFESPFAEKYQVIRHNEAMTVSVSQLISSDDSFNELLSSCVMDGYITRAAERKLRAMELKQDELVP